MAAGSHFVIQIVVLIWNGEKWFWEIGGYLKKKHLQQKLPEWFEQCSNRLLGDYNLIYIHFWSIYIYRQVCWERGNIHCVRPLGRMHTILVTDEVAVMIQGRRPKYPPPPSPVSNTDGHYGITQGPATDLWQCNWLKCSLARLSGLQCYNMGHNDHGINLHGVSMILM